MKSRNKFAKIITMAALAAGTALPLNRPPTRAASVEPTPGLSSASAVTFNRDVAPILFANCATCHHAGEVAPFPLVTYDDARRHVKEIVSVTHDHTMPPWKAKIGYGDFQNVRSLTAAQIQVIADWMKAGKPEGDPADRPAPPQFAEGWRLGPPDLVVKMSEPFNVPAEGRDVYHVFVLPLNLKEDKFVSAVEFRPSNPRIVHHCLMFLDSNGFARALEAKSTDKPGYPHVGGPGFTPSGGLGGWAPGVTPAFLADGVGRPVKAGSDLVIQTHFHPSGKAETEQSTIGLYFTKAPPSKVLVTFPKASRRQLDIPAGDADFVLKDSFVVPADVQLSGIFPHAHLLCQEIKVTATLPGGGIEQPLIWIPKWDWDWQDQYQYAKPISIPRGTRVDLEYHYNNSADNPRNPSSPPRHVTWGEQTADEMAITFFQLEMPRDSIMTGELGQRLRDRLRQRTTSNDSRRLGAGPTGVQGPGVSTTPSTRPVQ